MAVSFRKRAPVIVRPHVRGRLEPGVTDELTRYFTMRPDIRAGESADHGFDPMSDPVRYLAVERAERDSHPSLQGTSSPTVEDLMRWEAEENDHYARVAKSGGGLYVACWLAPDAAEALACGGEPPEKLHLTLAYLGDLAGLPGDAVSLARGAVAQVAAQHPPVTGRVSGLGVFRNLDSDALIALVDLPGLGCLRECLCDALAAVGLDVDETVHGFTPHITLGYLQPNQPVTLPPTAATPLTLATVAVVSPTIDGPTRQDIALTGFAFRKDQPDSGDVHVDGPMGEPPPEAGKSKKRKRRPHGPEISVLKADDERQVVYGIVLQPDVPDSQGDEVTKEDIETAAWRFLYDRTPLGLQHAKLAPDSVRPVESFLAPVDFAVDTPRGREKVVKGSWIVAAHVPDMQVWQDVKGGWFTGWSIAGTGRRTPAAR